LLILLFTAADQADDHTDQDRNDDNDGDSDSEHRRDLVGTGPGVGFTLL
jgi:hypothetical protein